MAIKKVMVEMAHTMAGSWLQLGSAPIIGIILLFIMLECAEWPVPLILIAGGCLAVLCAYILDICVWKQAKTPSAEERQAATLRRGRQSKPDRSCASPEELLNIEAPVAAHDCQLAAEPQTESTPSHNHRYSRFLLTGLPSGWRTLLFGLKFTSKCAVAFLSSYALQIIARGVPYLTSGSFCDNIGIVALVAAIASINTGVPMRRAQLAFLSSTPILCLGGLALWIYSGAPAGLTASGLKLLCEMSVPLALSVSFLIINGACRVSDLQLPTTCSWRLRELSTLLLTAAPQLILCTFAAFQLNAGTLSRLSGLFVSQADPRLSFIIARLFWMAALLVNTRAQISDISAMCSDFDLSRYITGGLGLFSIASSHGLAFVFVHLQGSGVWSVLVNSLLWTGGVLVPLPMVLSAGTALYSNRRARRTIKKYLLVLPIAASLLSASFVAFSGAALLTRNAGSSVSEYMPLHADAPPFMCMPNNDWPVVPNLLLQPPNSQTPPPTDRRQEEDTQSQYVDDASTPAVKHSANESLNAREDRETPANNEKETPSLNDFTDWLLNSTKRTADWEVAPTLYERMKVSGNYPTLPSIADYDAPCYPPSFLTFFRNCRIVHLPRNRYLLNLQLSDEGVWNIVIDHTDVIERNGGARYAVIFRTLEESLKQFFHAALEYADVGASVMYPRCGFRLKGSTVRIRIVFAPENSVLVWFNSHEAVLNSPNTRPSRTAPTHETIKDTTSTEAPQPSNASANQVTEENIQQMPETPVTVVFESHTTQPPVDTEEKTSEEPESLEPEENSGALPPCETTNDILRYTCFSIPMAYGEHGLILFSEAYAWNLLLYEPSETRPGTWDELECDMVDPPKGNRLCYNVGGREMAEKIVEQLLNPGNAGHTFCTCKVRINNLVKYGVTTFFGLEKRVSDIWPLHTDPKDNTTQFLYVDHNARTFPEN